MTKSRYEYAVKTWTQKSMFGWIVLGAGKGICDSARAGRPQASPSIATIVSDATVLPMVFVSSLVPINLFPWRAPAVASMPS